MLKELEKKVGEQLRKRSVGSLKLDLIDNQEREELNPKV